MLCRVLGTEGLLLKGDRARLQGICIERVSVRERDRACIQIVKWNYRRITRICGVLFPKSRRTLCGNPCNNGFRVWGVVSVPSVH